MLPLASNALLPRGGAATNFDVGGKLQVKSPLRHPWWSLGLLRYLLGS